MLIQFWGEGFMASRFLDFPLQISYVPIIHAFYLRNFQGPDRVYSWLRFCTFAECQSLRFVWIPALWRASGLSSRCKDLMAPSVASHFHLFNTLSWRMKQMWLSCFLAVSCFKGLNGDLFISQEMETSQWWQIY